MNEHILSAIDSHLERIAVALEALVEQRDQAAQAETRRLVGEYELLRQQARTAAGRFTAHDTMLLRRSESYATRVSEEDRRRNWELEAAAGAAEDRLAAFEAAHPEVVALAEEEAPA